MDLNIAGSILTNPGVIIGVITDHNIVEGVVTNTGIITWGGRPNADGLDGLRPVGVGALPRDIRPSPSILVTRDAWVKWPMGKLGGLTGMVR